MDVTTIVNGIVLIVTSAVCIMFVHTLSKSNTAQSREDLVKWAEIAVKAAEQLYDRFDGAKKKQYVVDFLRKKGYDINTEEVDNVIESQVLDLHTKIYGMLDVPVEAIEGVSK